MINNPIGIDYPIQEIQKIFIDELWADYKTQFNHRVFKNRDRNGNSIPEIYVKNSEYKEVLFNDRVDAISWFDVNEESNSFDGGQFTQAVGIFFAVNLGVLYPDLEHRAVEESHRDVLNLLDQSQVTGIITNLPAYGDYYTDKLKRFNMQPWHVFRINYLMQYSVNC